MSACPENRYVKLTATFVPAGPKGDGGELILKCPGCGADTAIRLAHAPAWR